MSETEAPESSSRWGDVIELRPQQLIQIALLGGAAGVVLWLLAATVQQIVLVPLFCGDPTNNLCASASGTAGNIATLITAVIALLGLVRLSVYRPLFIVIAAAISLWGLNTSLSGLPWFEAIAWSVLLYALTYVLFTWLVRLRSFVQALVVVLVVVILVRVLPNL